MKIISNINLIRKNKVLILNHRFQFVSSSQSKNFKLKLNQFLKKAHPDALQGKCSEEEITLNSKSVQELNLFINNLKDNLNYQGKDIEFNILDDIEVSSITKVKITLPELKQGQLNHSQRIWFSNKIDEILQEISNKQSQADEFGSEKEFNNFNSIKRPKVLKYSDILSKQQTKQISEEIKKETSDYKIIKKDNLLNLKVSKENRNNFKNLIGWAKRKTKDYKDLDEIMSWFYPYEMIYFNYDIKEEDVDAFLTSLKNVDFNVEANKIALELYNKQKNILLDEGIRFNIVCKSNDILLKSTDILELQSKGYSNIKPGMIDIPCNFVFFDFVHYIKIKGIEICKLKKNYLTEKKNLFDIMNILEVKYNIKIIDISNQDSSKIINYIDQTNKTTICLKRLLKVFNNTSFSTLAKSNNISIFIDFSEENKDLTNLFSVDEKIIINVGLKFKDDLLEGSINDLLNNINIKYNH